MVGFGLRSYTGNSRTEIRGNQSNALLSGIGHSRKTIVESQQLEQDPTENRRDLDVPLTQRESTPCGWIESLARERLKD